MAAVFQGQAMASENICSGKVTLTHQGLTESWDFPVSGPSMELDSFPTPASCVQTLALRIKQKYFESQKDAYNDEDLKNIGLASRNIGKIVELPVAGTVTYDSVDYYITGKISLTAKLVDPFLGYDWVPSPDSMDLIRMTAITATLPACKMKYPTRKAYWPQLRESHYCG